LSVYLHFHLLSGPLSFDKRVSVIVIVKVSGDHVIRQSDTTRPTT